MNEITQNIHHPVRQFIRRHIMIGCLVVVLPPAPPSPAVIRRAEPDTNESYRNHLDARSWSYLRRHPTVCRADPDTDLLLPVADPLIRCV